MDNWQRAVNLALQSSGVSSPAEVQSLNFDSKVKATAVGSLLPFVNLKELSLSHVGLTSLASFPRLPKLQRLILSDNKIVGGLEHLVAADLSSLIELDLSNNRVQTLKDLEPLQRLRSLKSLDLFACPLTKIAGYRTKVFNMLPTLEYLDKRDADGNEVEDSEDEDEDEDDDEEEDNGDESEEGEREEDDEVFGKEGTALDVSDGEDEGSGEDSVAEFEGEGKEVEYVDVEEEEEDEEGDDQGGGHVEGSWANRGGSEISGGEDSEEYGEEDDDLDDDVEDDVEDDVDNAVGGQLEVEDDVDEDGGTEEEGEEEGVETLFGTASQSRAKEGEDEEEDLSGDEDDGNGYGGSRTGNDVHEFDESDEEHEEEGDEGGVVTLGGNSGEDEVEELDEEDYEVEEVDEDEKYTTKYLVAPVLDDDHDELDYEPGEDEDAEDDDFDEDDDLPHNVDAGGPSGVKRKRDSDDD